MAATRPEYHLQRVSSDGVRGPIEIHSFADLDLDVSASRRDFVRTSVAVGAVLASLNGTDTSWAQGNSRDKLRSAIFAHTKSITALAFSPDSSLIVSASRDGSVKIWSRPNGKLLTVAHEGPSSVNALAITPDGACFAAAVADGTIRLGKLPGGEATLQLETPKGFKALAISPDLTLIAGAGLGGSVHLWKMSGHPLPAIALDDDTIHDLTFTPDSQTLISGGRSKQLRVWNLKQAALQAKAPGHDMSINAVAISPDGKVIVAGGNDGHLSFRLLSDMNRIHIVEGHNKAIVHDLAIDAKGTMVASCGSDSTIRLWSLADRQLIDTLDCPYSVTSLAFSPDNRLLAAGDANGVITLWDLSSGLLLGFLFDPSASSVHAAIVRVDIQAGIAYSLPCGTPIPAGATCTCNCVPGTYRAVEVATKRSNAKSDLEARKEALAQRRATKLERERIRAEYERQQIILRQQMVAEYYNRMLMRRSSRSSSGGTGGSRRCICIPVYR